MQLSVSMLFSLENNGGRAPMVSLFSLVTYGYFLALIFRFKFYAALSNARLHGANYRILIYSI